MDKRKCDVCGRMEDETHPIKFVSKANCFMCEKHRRQFSRYGRITDPTPGTIKDSNVFIEEDNCAKIIVKNRKQQIVAICTIDKEDLDKCKTMKWHINGNGYVHARSGYLSLHRFVLNYDGNLLIDHINRDKMDNRKSNLRIVTAMGNNQNRDCAGVCYDNHAHKWRAEFQRYNKYYYIGLFETAEEAKQARDKALKEVEKNANLEELKYAKANRMVGVSPSSHGKWKARFCKNGKVFYLGTFNTQIEAAIARNNAIKTYN